MTSKKVRVRSAPSPTGHDLKLPAPEPLVDHAWSYFSDRLPPRDEAPDAVREWFARLLDLFAPAVDNLEQFPAKSAFLFGFDPDAARTIAENAVVLSADSARTVLAEFAGRVRAHAGRVRLEDFSRWMNEIQAATGVKGNALFQPVRIALTGQHSGPDLARLVRLIEDGAALGLGVPSVCGRVERFVGV